MAVNRYTLIKASFWNSFENSFENSFWDSFWNSVSNSVWNSFGNSFGFEFLCRLGFVGEQVVGKEKFDLMTGGGDKIDP